MGDISLLRYINDIKMIYINLLAPIVSVNSRSPVGEVLHNVTGEGVWVSRINGIEDREGAAAAQATLSRWGTN